MNSKYIVENDNKYAPLARSDIIYDIPRFGTFETFLYIDLPQYLVNNPNIKMPQLNIPYHTFEVNIDINETQKA